MSHVRFIAYLSKSSNNDPRRYQGLVQNRYGMPNDEAEQMREGIKHKLYTDYILDGKQFLAPVPDNPQKIVDLGTGAGYWALDGMYTPSRSLPPRCAWHHANHAPRISRREVSQCPRHRHRPLSHSTAMGPSKHRVPRRGSRRRAPPLVQHLRRGRRHPHQGAATHAPKPKAGAAKSI